MNENIDLTKILKDCPIRFRLYSTAYGDVEFIHNNGVNPKLPVCIRIISSGGLECLTSDGKLNPQYNGECVLFPSKWQRDWSKFTAPWLKKERFDPKTLKPFDKVLARLNKQGIWCCELFSFIEDDTNLIKCCGAYYQYCIPYNDDTKHLVGTTEEAPEFYKYWED